MSLDNGLDYVKNVVAPILVGTRILGYGLIILMTTVHEVLGLMDEEKLNEDYEARQCQARFPHATC